MCQCKEPDESEEPTIIASVYTDHQKWIMRSDGSSELIGSTKTVTPGYKTGMKVKPNMPVKNYAADYHDLTAVYWLQYKEFFSSPFPTEHKFLCRAYSRQRAEIAGLTRQISELQLEVKGLRTNKLIIEVEPIGNELTMLGLSFLALIIFSFSMLWISDYISRRDRLHAAKSRCPPTPRPPLTSAPM